MLVRDQMSQWEDSEEERLYAPLNNSCWLSDSLVRAQLEGVQRFTTVRNPGHGVAENG